MKRVLITIFVATVVALPVAAEDVRESYFVATRAPAEQLIGHSIERTRQLGLDEFIGPSKNLEARFRTVEGFAARLTTSEVEDLRRSPFVRSVEPAGVVHATGLESSKNVHSVGPGLDPAAGTQVTPWGIGRVRASDIWPHTRGRTIRVGVIDTGIDYTHPDLAEIYAGGYDFVNEDEDPMDDNGHGTHVAGTIAAIDNDFGVVGIAPDVELYALKALDGRGSGNGVNVVRAVEWAIEHQLDIVNLSLGGPTSSEFEQTVYRRAAESELIVVAAAGNGHPDVLDLDYPAAYDDVVSVAAVDERDAVAAFSQQSTNLDFSAPGVGVASTYVFPLALLTEEGMGIQSRVMEYSPTVSVRGKLVSSGIGKPEQFTSEVVGQIAFIERGELTFAEKVTNAAAAGAVGVVVYNHTAAGEENGGMVNGTLGEPGEWITTVGISREAGLLLIGLGHPNVAMTTRSDYGTLNGTSMATPHVTGVFALMSALDPSLSPRQLFDAIRKGARDLGTKGRDVEFGFGVVDAFGAAQIVAPHIFGELQGDGDPDENPQPDARRRGANRRD